MRRGNGLALLLIVFGGLIILGKLGFGLGWLFGLLVPILLILLGVAVWNNGNKMLGGIIAIVGGFVLLGKMSFVLVWIAAIAAIVLGVSKTQQLPRSRTRREKGMTVIKRVRDITVATLNDRLEKAEDPVRVIDQFLWSTHQEITQSEGLQRQYAAHTDSLYRQWKDAEKWADKREQQALTALKAGEENVAKLALQDKVIHEESAQRYRDLYQQSRSELNDLELLLQELRSEYRAVYDRRQFYVARMESIRLQQRLNARFSPGGADTSQMFRKIDDRLTDIELETRSLRDLRRMGQETLLHAGEVVKNTIERELEELKRKLQQGG